MILREANNYKNEDIFCEKRNASTPLGIEPRTFRLPVEDRMLCDLSYGGSTTFLTETC